MKKVLAALVVVAVSSFGSMAFAEGEAPVVKGNIEIYGAAKLSFDTIDTGASRGDTSLSKISSNSSRVGFKGVEALSDDLSAVYQLELGVNMDGTTTTVATSVTNTTTGAVGTTSVNSISLRNTYVGLKSKAMGMVILGTHDTPYKSATGQFDAFADSMGDYNAIIGNVNGAANFDLRPKDVIAYVSPSLGGVTITIFDVLTGSETAATGAKSTPTAYSASVAYAGGPLNIALAYETHKNGIATWDVMGTPVTGTKLGAGYTIGGTKIGLVYESLKDDAPNSLITRNAMYLAVSQKLGNETIKLAYGNAAKGEKANTDNGATMMVVGADHSFSKRTTAYVLYAAMNNNKAATYGLGQSGAGGAFVPAAGEDPSVISFGVNHSF